MIIHQSSFIIHHHSTWVIISFHRLSLFIIIYSRLPSPVIIYYILYIVILYHNRHFGQIKVSTCLVKLQYITYNDVRGRQATGWFFGVASFFVFRRRWDMFLQAQNAKFFVRGVGGWGYVNVPWTCKDGWMLYNRCWRNINMYNCMLPYQLYVGPLNSEAGQTDGMGAVKLGAFYRTLVLIKTKRKLRYIEISINKLPRPSLCQNFPSWSMILPFTHYLLGFSKKVQHEVSRSQRHGWCVVYWPLCWDSAPWQKNRRYVDNFLCVAFSVTHNHLETNKGQSRRVEHLINQHDSKIHLQAMCNLIVDVYLNDSSRIGCSFCARLIFFERITLDYFL